MQFESEKSEDAVNLDLCNSQSGTDKMLQLKGRNTSQAPLESTESSAGNLSGDTVPTKIVVILIQSLLCPHKGKWALPTLEVTGEGTRGIWALLCPHHGTGACHPSCSRHILDVVMGTDLECKVSKQKKSLLDVQ